MEPGRSLKHVMVTTARPKGFSQPISGSTLEGSRGGRSRTLRLDVEMEDAFAFAVQALWSVDRVGKPSPSGLGQRPSKIWPVVLSEVKPDDFNSRSHDR